MSARRSKPSGPGPAAPPGADRAIFGVDAPHAGQRVDRLVAAWCRLSRDRAKRLFDEGNVALVARNAPLGTARRATKGELCELGARVVVSLPPGVTTRAEAAAARPDPGAGAALCVVLETQAVVVVDKPAGQPSAPLRSDELGTVANALVARYPEMAALGHRPLEPGLCHRLDNGTSGLLLAARAERAFFVLTAAIREGRLQKGYLLVCPSAPLDDSGVIDLPLGPDRHHAGRVAACVEGRGRVRGRWRPATTSYRVLERRGASALVEAEAPRALRHQIRAHFAAIGAPLHGDELYGSTQAASLGRHALHACRIEWPGDDELPPFRASSALPDALRALLDP